ncbi:MAG: oligosaccharide flippase family protein [Pseudomonadota bacterium]
MSLLFSFVEKYALLLVGLASGMILSRLLTPAETGVYSVGAVLLGMAQVLRDFGVGQYLIQERDLSADKLRAVLATSFLFAWSLAGAIALSSFPMARFYHEARLATVLQLLALNFLLIPFSAVTLPMLRRQMRFGAICAINLTQGICNFVLAVVLAWRGFGYLSLALASVAATLAALLLGLYLRPPHLPWMPSRKGMGAILRFGTLATGGTLIDEVGVAAPDLIIGKLIGMEGVGVFGKALGMLAVFNDAVTSVVSPVVFPLYAARARDAGDAAAVYLRTVSYMSAFAFPFFACLALMAAPLVRLLFGPQWDAAVPLIRIMCTSAAIYSMFSMARHLFVAIGQVGMQARLDALAVPVRVLALLGAAPFGLAGMAWAVVVGSLFRSWLTLRYLRRLAGLGFVAQLAAARKSLALASICSCAPLTLLVLGATDKVLALSTCAVATVALWLLGLLVLAHPLDDELQLFRRKLAAFAIWPAK